MYVNYNCGFEKFSDKKINKYKLRPVVLLFEDIFEQQSTEILEGQLWFQEAVLGAKSPSLLTLLLPVL